MRCAGCGAELDKDDLVCATCGSSILTPASAAGEQDRMARVVTRLSRYYLLFAGLNAVLGVMGLVTTRLGWQGSMGPWEPWPHPPLMAWTHLGTAAWGLLVVRVATALAAWDALRKHADCGRGVAIVAGAVAMTQFPIGLMLGAYTLVSLIGKRGAVLYGRLRRA